MKRSLSLLMLVVLLALAVAACGPRVEQSKVLVKRNPNFGQPEEPRFLPERKTYNEEYGANEGWEALPVAVIEKGHAGVTDRREILQPGTYPKIAAEEVVTIVPTDPVVWSTLNRDALNAGHCNRWTCETTPIGVSSDGIQTAFDLDVQFQFRVNGESIDKLLALGSDPEKAVKNSLGLIARDKFLPRVYTFDDMYSGAVRLTMGETIFENLRDGLEKLDSPIRTLSVTIRDIQPADDRIKKAKEALALELATQKDNQALFDTQLAQVDLVLEHLKDEPWPVKVTALMVIFDIEMPAVVKLATESQRVPVPVEETTETTP